jgi:hypothetical protein
VPAHDPLRPAKPIEVATLLGSSGLDLSLRCLQSFVTAAGGTVSIRLHEDGTLSEADLAELSSALPISRIVRKAEADRVVEGRLAHLPACVALRRAHVLALKLFDCVFFEHEATLCYVDSDVLFLRPFAGAPVHPESDVPIFFPDEQSAYSIRSTQLLRAGAAVLPAMLNTGFFSFPVRQFQLDAIERFLRGWTGRTPPWIEQTCWAVTAGIAETRLLSRNQFRIFRPERPVSDEVIALHFVSSVRSHLRSFASGTGMLDGGRRTVSRTTAARRLTPLRLGIEELSRAARRLARRAR